MGLEGVLLEQGFTFAYDKRLLDSLHSADRAARTRDHLSASFPDPSHLARFLENHDEARSAATLGEHLASAASLLASVPGMRFFFDGQLEGRRIKAPVQLGRWPEEPPDEAVRRLYERALAFARARVLHEGEWKLLTVSTAGDPSFGGIVAYRWRSPDSLALVVVNLGAATAQAHVAIGADLVPGGAFDFDDRLTDATYRWTRESLLDRGLYVRLEAGGAHLFHVQVLPESNLDSPRLQTE